MLQLRAREQHAIAALAIILVAVMVYFGVVFPRDSNSIFPWSSDAWGHLIKAVYLEENMADGNFYPDIFPDWYSGQQMLRYFPPLSYYLLVGIHQVTGNIFTAGNLFIFATALIGGLAFLLFASRVGLFWATLGGILYILFPDNIRVAFAEGNLPRLIATAVLPFAFYFLLNLLENGGRRRDFAGVVISVGVVVLSHAMMAGIFMLGLGMYAVSYWLVASASFRVIATGIGALATGLMVSGWWLLPSLTGGITELNNSAASEAIAEFPVNVSLNPALRSTDNEIFYVGLSVFILAVVALLMWKRFPIWVRALIPVTLVMTLIGSAMFVDGWRALPAHQLFWPIRFMSFAGLCLVLVTVMTAREMYRAGIVPERRWLRLAAVAVIALVFVDFQPSVELIRSRERPAAVQQVADDLRQLEGWRVATADLSRLGSAPAMLFTTEGGREQVFGWAFQGSITAPLLARINEALTRDYLEYAVSRLSRLGTDDVVVLPVTEFSKRLDDALEADGFELHSSNGALQLYHRDGQPRAQSIPLKVLGVGDGANNAALIFPQMIVGSSFSIEDYPMEFLELFDVIVLSRFETADRGRAEARVRELAEEGKRIVVDMTAAPTNAFSRQPKFLGVYGEPVLQIGQAIVTRDGERTAWLPFSQEFGEWRSVTPQGADEDLVFFEYPAANGSVISRNSYGDGEVLFLGLNMIFHAAITGDRAAIRLLEEVTGLQAGEFPQDMAVPLSDYEKGPDGWQFGIHLDSPQWVLFPMAFHGGTRVTANGQEVESIGIERLTLARMPAGDSAVQIRYVRTGIYSAGIAASALGLLALAAYLAGMPLRLRFRGRRESTETGPGAGPEAVAGA